MQPCFFFATLKLITEMSAVHINDFLNEIKVDFFCIYPEQAEYVVAFLVL